MMRYEESGDFATTLHRRLLYILNENLPGSTWYCIAMKMLQYYGDLDMISIEEMASLCAVSKSTISKFIRIHRSYGYPGAPHPHRHPSNVHQYSA